MCCRQDAVLCSGEAVPLAVSAVTVATEAGVVDKPVASRRVALVALLTIDAVKITRHTAGPVTVVVELSHSRTSAIIIALHYLVRGCCTSAIIIALHYLVRGCCFVLVVICFCFVTFFP